MDDVAFEVDEINCSIAEHWREESDAGICARRIQTAEPDAPPADRILIDNRNPLGGSIQQCGARRAQLLQR